MPIGKKLPTNNSWQLTQVKNYLFKPENNYLGNFCGSDSIYCDDLRVKSGYFSEISFSQELKSDSKMTRKWGPESPLIRADFWEGMRRSTFQ